jgi:hypothetical protein
MVPRRAAAGKRRVNEIGALTASSGQLHQGESADVGACRRISRTLSPGLLQQLLRLHAESGRDLLDSYVAEVVAWPQRQQDVAVLVFQSQMLVLARDDYVAVALERVLSALQ